MSDNAGHTVVITGMGAVTPIGTGVDAYWHHLVQGIHGFGPISVFNAAPHRTQNGAEVRTLPEFMPRRLGMTLLSRSDVMQLTAAREALTQAGLFDNNSGAVIAPDMGLVGATAAGGILGLETFFRCRYHNNSCQADRLLTSFCLSSLATNVAKEFRIRGPRATTATVCSSSGLALAAALELLRLGEVRHVLVIAAESLCEVTHAGFNALRSIAPEVCQPFDRERKGLVLGEGAGAMVLELAETAAERGAEAFATFCGYGLTTDLHHFTAPEPDGGAIAATLRKALANSRVDEQEVDYINAHGTGTPLNDAAECQGIKVVFGEAAGKLAISASKSMIGHALGAASLLEAIATIKALRNNVVPPTANINEPEPACGLDITPNRSRQRTLTTAISNSFAFGGSNISLVFRKEPAATTPGGSQPVLQQPVITGIGLVSPLGIGRQAFIDGLATSTPGMSALTDFGPEWSEFKGSLVDLPALREKIEPKRRRHLNRLGQFLTVAFNEALAHAGLEPTGLGPDAAMTYGSAWGCSSNVHAFYTQLLSKGPTVASPQEFMLSVTNAPAALVAQHAGMSGPLWVFVADEASWEASLHWACRLIAQGIEQRVIVTAADEISESILAIHQALGFLTDDDDDNFIPGEGAVVMVFESAKLAADRGASVHGILSGWATMQDDDCGPMECSTNTDLFSMAQERCLAMEQEPITSLCYAGGGCWSAARRLLAKGADRLREKNVPLSHAAYRSFWGESGVAGGFALAAALLDPKMAGHSHLLVPTTSRGGIQAATLVRRQKGI